MLGPMPQVGPELNQLNLTVADMDATLAFYRALGLSIKDAPEWPPGSGARHTAVAMPNGMSLEIDNLRMAPIWYPGEARRPPLSGCVIGFSLPTREAVDERFAALTAAGYATRLAPHDAFWGARSAIVLDPDLSQVGLMSPIDEQWGFTPAP